jgi:predicted GNAT family acetyltransferase
MRRTLQNAPLSVRALGPAELGAALRILQRDPIANAPVTARVQHSRLDPWKLGGELWGWWRAGRLESLCYAGANTVPVGAGPDAVRAFAERARRYGRRCTSVVGPRQPTELLWQLLEPEWGPAREIRVPQPLLAAERPDPAVPADPLVRRVAPHEYEAFLPACVAMFTEEVGLSPLSGQDGGRLYRAGVAELIASGRAFARFEDGRVVFKAEVGVVTDQVCQVQGVWMDPAHRGRGLAAPAMTAVMQLARREIAPTISLYVNDYNLTARALYRRVGFHEVGTMMSVLF